jgi:hypothetical protein
MVQVLGSFGVVKLLLSQAAGVRRIYIFSDLQGCQSFQCAQSVCFMQSCII